MSERIYLSGTSADQVCDADSLDSYKVLLVLGSGFEDAEVVSVLDVFGWTAYRPSVATVQVVKTGFHAQVKGAFGSQFEIDVPLNEVSASKYDALVIPGGFHNLGYDELYQETAYKLIREARDCGLPIATMCVGACVVAQAGVLQGGRGTSFELSSRHDNTGLLEQCGCQAMHASMEEWDGILTCSGPAQSEQVAMRLLELVAGAEAALEIKKYRTGLRL